MRYAAIALLLLPVLATAGEWYFEVVDDAYTFDTSLVLDDSGYPHIAYDYLEEEIKYAYWDGYCWHCDTVCVGMYLYCESLALDSLSYPHILFSSDYFCCICYARWNGSSWNFTYLYYTESGFDYVGYTSLALDGNDYPHIAYHYFDWSEDTDYLYYVYWDGSGWRYDTVEWGYNLGWNSSLAIDNSDNPHISYGDYDNDTLKYARWNGSDWLIEVVDSGFNVRTTSLALDSSFNPHISYFDSDNEAVMYARWDGADWQIDTVDTSLGQYGGEPSLTLDSSDYPHISYEDNESDELKYARWDGVTWQIEVVDSHIAYHPSLELDENDYPHISYYDSGDDVLKYAHYVPYGFHLLEPERGEIIDTTTPLLNWGDTQDPDHQSYTLWWGTYPDYSGYNEVTGIADSEYQIAEGIEDGDRIYWRVKSIDDQSEECWAAEMDWYFDVDLICFHLLDPELGEVVDTLTPLLDWEDSHVPGHESYTLWWGTDPDFDTYNEVTGIGESKYTIADGIQDGDRIWWRVKSIDEDEEEYWAVEMDWYFDVDTGGGVDIVDFVADAEDEGILVNWRIEGDSPAGLRVLRSVGDAEPVAIHHNPLPGSAVRWLDNQVEASVEYVYWLEVTEADGTMTRFGPTEPVTVPEYIPELILYAAYPNPSREVINFVFSLPDEGWVTLSVYDLSGRRVASLVSSDMTAGRHEVSWSCADVESGVYLYRLETGADSITQRLVIAR